jgi:son of sevenless-like protein
MYTRRTVAPLIISTGTNQENKPGVFTTATFRYVEEPVTSNSRRRSPVSRVNGRQPSLDIPSPHRQQRNSPQRAAATAYPGSTASPPGMFVRALYDYDADDTTSLSFRKGDIIQVITQLESGWWDGIINEVRGWFPSNYCAVIVGPGENGDGSHSAYMEDNASGESGAEDDYEDHARAQMTNGNQRNGPQRSLNGSDSQDQEEAAFWIPQATPDGRLFYFNTLTGVSTMELPLETPTSIDETGPRDRMNIRAPEQTRPPPEMMARGYEVSDDDDTTSASEAEGEGTMMRSRGAPRRRRSYISEGASPTASMESSNTSPITRARNDSQDFPSSQPVSTTRAAIPTTSYTGSLLGQYTNNAVPRSFFDDGSTPPVTWNRLVDNMRKAVESYRQVINNADRAEYVRKAEDISDHLRMLLAAGSGTTDNHSGNPSVISTNKALYPHFREMMSKFSKLVLSSHIAAADWPAADSYSKCLQEAEGVMNGVYGFVEVARAQRGEDIQRLVPGFVLGSSTGGNWLNNNLGGRDPMTSTSFMDQDDFEPFFEASAKLDPMLLERMDELKRMIVSSIRRLDDQLVMPGKIVTPSRHEQLANAICAAAGKVIEYFRPYISTVESIDLSPLSTAFQVPQVSDFGMQKQRLYDLIASLLIACQTVAGPLSDEWADVRGEPLETRVRNVRDITNQLETCVSQVGYSLQLLHESLPRSTTSQGRGISSRDGQRRLDGDTLYDQVHSRNGSKAQRPQQADIYPEGIDPAVGNYNSENSKVKKFFGEVPMLGRTEETPAFLKLDHEGEISFDTKVDPPQLRGGTLTALVEQLTRHDRLDSPFNNTFLLTYRSFTTSSELFEMLVKRFSIQPPRGITQDDYNTWAEKKQKPIRFRVVNILKSWFDQYWMENNDDASMALLRRVYSFAQDSVATTNTPGSGPLMTIVEQRLRGQDATSKRLVQTVNANTPQPIMPKNMKKLKFLDIDVTEFARQLTIIESRLYGKIKPAECLNKTWQKKLSPDEPEPAPNVKALILHSNQLTNWVAEMILTQADVKKRVVVIKHFVSVAEVN